MQFSAFFLPCYRDAVAPTLGAFYDELTEAARLADQSGWARIWQSEHHFHYYGGAVPNPAMMLLRFADVTERIRLGSGISLLTLNDPLRVAEDYAMLDQLSGGRLDFGIGRGYLPHELGGFGIGADDATERFREAYDVVMRAWSGEAFAHDGGHFKFDRLGVLPAPLQTPPPVWVACSRTRESFDWAGANGHALMMNHYPMSDAELRERFGWFADAYAKAGHDPSRREAMLAVFLHIADSEEQAIADAKPAVQEHANLFRLLLDGDVWSTDYEGDESVFDFIAPGGNVMDALRERTAVGTVDQVRDRIAYWRDIGFTEISFVLRYGTLSHEQCLANMRTVTEKIAPSFPGAS